MHLSFAGPGAVTVSWVTWAQEDPEYNAARESVNAAAATLVLGASRKLQMEVSLGVGLDRHRHHRRRRRHDDDPDLDIHCRAVRAMGLRSAVQWGTASGQYEHTIFGNFDCYSTTAYDSGALHHVTIGDREGPLPAETTVYYRVGDPARDEWSEEAHFKTAPPVGPSSLPYRLGLIGDLGQTEHSLSTLEHAAAAGPDSFLLLGDLSYADGYQPRWDTWGRMMSSVTRNNVWMFTEGNHEIERSNGDIPDFLAYTSRFTFPSEHSRSVSPLYYSYDLAGAHIIMLGSYTDYGRDSAQYAWLERDLAAVDRRRTPWVLVGMHAPWYNSNHNHYGEGEEMRLAMEGLLYEHGVDAVLAGHVHAYERGYATYDNEPDPCGPVYVNVGDGGNREGLDFDYYQQPDWSAFREPSYGSGFLDMMNSTHARFVWHRNQDGTAEVADEVELVRDPECRVGGRERLAAKLEQNGGNK